MFARYIIFMGLLLIASPYTGAQELFRYKGQLSAYTHINSNDKYPWWNGIRYIPQLNLNIPTGDKK